MITPLGLLGGLTTYTSTSGVWHVLPTADTPNALPCLLAGFAAIRTRFTRLWQRLGPPARQLYQEHSQRLRTAADSARRGA